MKKWGIIAGFCLLSLISCRKTIDLDIPTDVPQAIVVEGYVNQQFPQLNYVILSRTAHYLDPDTNRKSVRNALVFVTEGTENPDGTINWNEATRKRWIEITDTRYVTPGFEGFYADSTLLADPTQAFLGKEAHHYRLEVQAEGKSVTATTYIPQVVSLDSITYQIKTNPLNDKKFGQITVHYGDPAEFGNRYISMYDSSGYAYLKGWGSVVDMRIQNDESINGVYRDEIRFTRFTIGDTVNYYLNSISQPSYNFWEQVNQQSGGPNPFTGNVPIPFTVNADGFIGGFTGMAVSHKRIIIKE